MSVKPPNIKTPYLKLVFPELLNSFGLNVVWRDLVCQTFRFQIIDFGSFMSPNSPVGLKKTVVTESFDRGPIFDYSSLMYLI